MKFMKLGSRPDTFYTKEAVRSVSSEVSSDIIIQVKGSKYLLHKFPLLSKSLYLQKLCFESPEASNIQILQLPDFPGGDEAFEMCAKFCYGITITLSAYNIVSIWSAAEYLQMTEDVDKGNLIHKVEVFFSSCILNGWKDSIVALQSTKGYPYLSEDLGITSRCIGALAAKVLGHPVKVSLSHSYSRRDRDILSGSGSRKTITSKGWWGEDLAELGIDLYWRTMIAIKSGGKVPAYLIGDAIRIYASRWLPNISKQADTDCEKASTKHRMILDSIVSLLPGEKGAVSCSFLLKLLKAANILKASSSTKMELARRIGLQLEGATVGDLLIPILASDNEVMYDVDMVMNILEHFLSQRQSPNTSPLRTKGDFERRRSRSAENVDSILQESRRSSSTSHGSKIKVAKVMDCYLQEIAQDKNLPLSKFIAIADAIPEFSRLDHDDLYKAIDLYLKVHPELNKSERKRLCRTLDCKKLSMEACMHAAQNEMLPLRVVVQVLFFEQARAAVTNEQLPELPNNIKALLAAQKNTPTSKVSFSAANSSVAPEDQLSISGLKSPRSKLSTLKMKLAEDDDLDESFVVKSKVKSFSATPNRSRRMFSKLWPVSRTASEKS